MPSKNPQDAGYGASSQDSTDDDSAPSTANTGGRGTGTGNSGNKGIMRLIMMLVILVVVIVVAYYVFLGPSSQSLTSSQIFTNVTNSSLNQTQALFVNDLERSQNVSSLYVSYAFSNATTGFAQLPTSGSPGPTTPVSSSINQTITSYKLGAYNRTVIRDVAAIHDQDGSIASENVSSIYYYNTNTTLTCFNDTVYSSGIVTNSSLQCASGDQGLSYLEQAPFTAANVSSLSYLIFNNTVTYAGTKSIAGRSCDDFLISNATSTNLLSNYTEFNLCIDTQYGILLYMNETDVVAGAPSSFAFTATAVSAEVPSSDFVIPQQYLNATSSSII